MSQPNDTPVTPEEEEAWKELEEKLEKLQEMTKEALQAYLDRLKK